MSNLMKPKMSAPVQQPDPELERLEEENKRRKKAQDRVAKGGGLAGTILTDLAGQTKKSRLGG